MKTLTGDLCVLRAVSSFTGNITLCPHLPCVHFLLIYFSQFSELKILKWLGIFLDKHKQNWKVKTVQEMTTYGLKKVPAVILNSVQKAKSKLKEGKT